MDGAVAVIIVTKRIMKAFVETDATSPDKARTKAELHIRSRVIFDRLISRGVIKQVSADRYYMDLQEQASYLRRRRLLVLAIAAAVVMVALIATFVWR
jgi:phosphotransferase system  glucose/maltose/N-acetylglucosamine-specific IIC component